MRRLQDVRTLTTAKREALLTRLERITELPLLILAFVMIPLLIGPFLWDLSPGEEATFATLDAFIWALFAVDLGVKVFVAPSRLDYLRAHRLEVLIVVVPFLRPLRLLRLFLFGARAFGGARRLVHIDFLLVYGIGLVVIAATVAYSVEEGETGSITSFADALWWALATVTTVGYGDAVPVTNAGRAIGFVLMIEGIGFFGALTANLASILVRGDVRDNEALGRLVAEVERLRQDVASLRGSATD